MKNSLRLILLAALTMVCGNMLAQESTTIKWESTSGNALTTIYPDGNISLKWEEGGGDQAPKYSGNSVLFYNGNRLTVSGRSSDVTITKIVFTYSSGSASLVTCNASGKNESQTGIVNSYSGMTTTWTGEANSLIFRAAAKTNNRYISSIEVTYTGGSSAPVVTAPVLNITQDNIASTYDMDTNGVFVVYYKNEGTAAAENAKLTLYVDGVENASKTIGTLAIGASDFWNAKYDVTKIEAGEHQVYLSLNADDVDAFNTDAKTVTFTKAAPEATFTVTATTPVNVAYGSTSFNINATVTNTSETVDATNVEIKLYNNGVVDTKTIESLAHGASTNVTFTINATEEAPFVAGRTVNYFVQAPKNQSQAEVAVVFEAAPVEEVKDLAITDVTGTLDLSNTSNNVRVIVKNNGTVDITDAVVTLKAGETVLGTANVSAKAEQTGFCYIAVASEGLTAGTLDVIATVEVAGDATPADNTKDATLTVQAAAAPEATFAITAENIIASEGEEIKAAIKVKNTSEINASDVTVKVLNGTTIVAETTIASLAANEEKEIELTLGTFAVGSRDLQIVVNNKTSKFITVTVNKAVEQVVDIALIDIRGLENINLAAETNAVQVWFTNNSTVENLNATITLKMNGTEVGTQTIAKGERYKTFPLSKEGLTAGETANLVATLNVENNKEGNLAEVTKTLDIVSGEAVAEPTFELTAENVEVLTTATKVKAVVNVKNTSEVKAAQVEVKLLQGMNQLGESKYIFGLEAGANQNVTFEFDNFDKAGTYELQAVAGKTGKFFNVVVKEPVADLAIESISGTINLNNTTNNVTVTVKNNGTADVKDAKVTLSFNETVLEKTVSVKAGEQGYAYFQVPSEGISGETLTVTAQVEVENDPTATDNTKTAELTVNAADAPQATFTVTAENVTVPAGATSFNIVAKVKNTSEVAAENVEVKLFYNTVIETKTVEALAAGAETDVTFTVAAPEGGFQAGKTTTYYVQAGTSQAEVAVTFAQETVAEVKDLAIESIQGTIDLSASQSNVTVTVKNNGNVDVNNAKVTLSYGETTLEKTVSAKVGEQGYAYFQIVSEGITGETLAVTAKVELEGDNTPADNEKTENLTVTAAPAAEATFSVTANNVTVPFGAESFEIKATVKNTSEVAASNVEVKLLAGLNAVETKTINALAAGAEEIVTFTISEINKTVKTYYVQVAGKAQAEVGVTYAEAPTESVVDMALTQIQGVTEINLKQENKVLVWYQNNGNVATTATISAKLNNTDLTAQTVENVRPEAQSYVTFTLPVEGLTAGETANFEATITAEGDTNAENNTVSKQLTIVSGEAEPQAEIAINPISGWEVTAGEQTVNVNVSLFNNGDAEAKDVKVQLYKDYPTILDEKTVDVPFGENNYKMLTFSFNYTFEEGKSYEFTVFTNYADANADNQMQTFTLNCPAPLANVTIAKIANIEATTTDQVKVAATLKNTSSIAAKDVKVGIYKLENYQYQLVGIQQTIDEIAAGAEQGVEFNLGQLEAGNYTYYVRVDKVNGNTTTTTQDVNVKVTEAQAEIVDVALTQIQGLSNIDLAEGAQNTITVWMENKGNVAANASVTVKIGETTLDAQSTTVAVNKNGYVTFTLPTEGLTVGTQVAVTATLTVNENTSTEVELTRIYDVVNSSVATEAVFELSAAPVEVEFGTEKFNVVATVKNSSTIDATNVEVSLFYNGNIATQTIASLAAGAETTVTFADVENPFTKAGEYTMFVQAPKANCEVKITVKPEPVVETVEVALTAIQGISNIDLAEGANNIITVWADNKGNVDVEATINVTLNGTALEAQTVSLNAGKNGAASFTLPTEGLTVGTKATVVATVTVADNTSAETSLTREYDVVNSSVANEPVYEVTATPVEFEFGAEKFNVVATVKNTNNIAAENVEVKLFYNGVIDTKTVSIAANGTINVTFDNVVNPFSKAGTYTMYVQVPNAQAEVTVTVKPEAVEEKIDLAVTAIQGTLSLEQETNYLTVFVENKGTLDMTNVQVSVEIGNGVYTNTIATIKAGMSGFCSVAIPTTDLQAGETTVVAKVAAEGDADITNNTLEKTYTIEAKKADLSISTTITKNHDGSFDVNVNVSNNSDFAADNIVVTIYDENSNKLDEKTVTIEANDEATATFNLDETYEGQNIQLFYTGASSAVWVKVEETITDGITSIDNGQKTLENCFTLSGKKVNSIRKGNVYIVNGRKVVIK